MKFIEDLRDKFEGEEIWVIGAGPSLDRYPLDFFKDKICVGMNWVFSVFLDLGDGHKKFGFRKFYSVHEHREHADWIAKHKPEFLKNCFFLLPPVRRDGGGRRGYRMVWWEDYNEDPYYMRWGLKGHMAVSATDNDFAEAAKCISKKQECRYVCRGTTMHWAIQAAAVLGAKKVYVVGGESRGGHMCKHGSMYNQFGNRDTSHPQWLSGTRSLAKVFKPFGVEIVFYYYGKGEQR